jgi:hypothetical protein
MGVIWKREDAGKATIPLSVYRECADYIKKEKIGENGSSRDLCDVKFLRGLEIGSHLSQNLWTIRRYFWRMNRKESCFHNRKQLSLTPSRVSTRLEIRARRKS